MQLSPVFPSLCFFPSLFFLFLFLFVFQVGARVCGEHILFGVGITG